MRYLSIGLVLTAFWGCGDLPETGEKPTAASGENANGAAQGDGQRRGGGEDSGIFGKKTREVLDAKRALQKPNVTSAGPAGSGSDSLSEVGSTYSRLASQVGTMGVNQWIRHHKALNGRPPTYDELQAWLNEHPRVEFPVLPGGQKYGYNEDTGEIVILEFAKPGGR